MKSADAIRAMYAAHPISASHILQKLGPGPHEPEALWAHDQDHYGGLAANAALADAARMRPGARVADFCAGLGGPARWFADQRDVEVVGVDLTPERVAGAKALTEAVGLSDRVRVVEGSVMEAPLADSDFDAVVSQEAFLHLPDKTAALREAHRILRPGGRLAFTDVTAERPLGAEDEELLRRGLSFVDLNSVAAYRSALADVGFEEVEFVDLSTEWTAILRERLAMYLALRDEAAAAGAPAGDAWFHRAYPRFVALIAEGVLGGARFAATRP